VNQHKFSRMDQGQPKPNRMSAQRTKLTSGKEAKEPEHMHPAVQEALRPRDAKGQYLSAIETEERPEIVAMAIKAYSRGMTIKEIAETYGVTNDTIYSWILAETGPKEYANLITGALTSKIAKADNLLEVADSPLDLARARELARFSRMDYERRRPHLYGVKQEITNITPPPILSITIAPQQLPEKDVTPDTPE
jgi:transposase-like protein